MPVPTDPGDYGSGAPITSAGQNLRVKRLYDALNPAATGLDEANVQAALLKKLGLNDAAQSQVGRGKSIIPTTESRTNVAYGTLTTPDQVSGIVLPTDGLIVVAYQATWQSSVGAAGNAALFIGATQLKMASTASQNPIVATEATTPAGAATDGYFHTVPNGFTTGAPAGGYLGDVTTGQVLGSSSSQGGACTVFAAAGTYTISVQFKASSGSVTAKNRKLWVWTIGF